VHGVQTTSAVAVHAVDAQPPLALQSVQVEQTALAAAVHAVDAQPPLALQSVHATQLEPERKVEPATHESEASRVKPPMPPPSPLNLAQPPLTYAYPLSAAPPKPPEKLASPLTYPTYVLYKPTLK
jgi:hypothetical protein